MTTTQILAAPLVRIFADRDEAEWALSFLERSMMLLGVKGPDDRRCAITIPKSNYHNLNLLRFNLGMNLTVDFRGAKHRNGRGIALALKRSDFLKKYSSGEERLKQFLEPVSHYFFPFEVVRKMTHELEDHYEDSFRYMGEATANLAGGPFGHLSKKVIMEAIFDHEKRKVLFGQGIVTPPLVDNPGMEIGNDPPIVILQSKGYTLAQCVAETGIAEATLTEWLEAIERKGQAILYGPPGTGKTYVGERLARLLVADGGGITELVQFHPAYAYEDFIQGIRPQTSAEGHLIYPTVPGRFLEFCREAEKHSGICVLILDEINRANLSRVFGELMYLLEYRDRDIPLAGGGRLRIPKNVRILGTMNTADRSIALVDHALRRRFLFIALSPDMEVLRRFHQDEVEAFPVDKLIQVLERLNQRIQDRNYAVGTSYFLRKKLRGSILTIWRMEIEPYLEEYFFAQPDRIDEFRWQKVHEDLGL